MSSRWLDFDLEIALYRLHKYKWPSDSQFFAGQDASFDQQPDQVDGCAIPVRGFREWETTTSTTANENHVRSVCQSGLQAHGLRLLLQLPFPYPYPQPFKPTWQKRERAQNMINSNKGYLISNAISIEILNKIKWRLVFFYDNTIFFSNLKLSFKDILLYYIILFLI